MNHLVLVPTRVALGLKDGAWVLSASTGGQTGEGSAQVDLADCFTLHRAGS